MKLQDCAVGQEVEWEADGHKYEGMIVKVDTAPVEQQGPKGQPYTVIEVQAVYVLALTEDGEEAEPASGDPTDREDEWQRIAATKLTLVERE